MLNSLRIPLLLLLMLASGLAGISYEILYGRLFGNMIGDQFIVSASVLITFLLGIGIGALLAWRLSRWLWLIEGAIGAVALALVAGREGIEWLLYHAWPMAGIAGSLLFCCLFLLLPALLIGCSVPLFAHLLQREGLRGQVFSTVYAVYNLGAAATALLIEFWLLRRYGIAETTCLFAAVNLSVAALLFFAYRGPREGAVRGAAFGTGLAGGEWLALVLASVASASFQLWSIKIAEMVLGPFRDSFAIVLALVLTGLVLGAAAVRFWRVSLATVLAWAAAGLLVAMLLLEPVMTAYAYLFHFTVGHLLANTLLKIAVLAALVLPAATAFGATIPALLRDEDQLARDSGRLLFVSALANAAGFLLMTLLLHRWLAYGAQLLVVIAVVLLALLAASDARRRFAAGLLAGAFAIGTLLLFPRFWNESLLYIGYTSFEDRDDLAENLRDFDFADAYRGFQDVFSISWMDGDPYFFINGYISIPLNNPSEKVVGAVSSIFAPRRERALVLGLGSGATASAVGRLFAQTEVVEINPVVRENLFRMRRWNYDIEHNPKVRIHVDDAIHFMRVDPQPRYDMILNTVTTPLYFSSAKLYSADFFRDIKRNLKPDGLYVTWMDSRIGDRGAKIILRTLQGAFRHCALLYVKSAYFLLLCSDEPITAFAPDAPAADALMRADLWRKYEINAKWLQYQLLTTDAYRLAGDGAAPLNTLDYPALEFAMSSGRDSGFSAFKRRLYETIHATAMRAAARSDAAWDPGGAIVHARRMLHDSSIYRHIRDALGKEEPHGVAAWNRALLARDELAVAFTPSARHWYRLGKRRLALRRYQKAAEAFAHALARDETYSNAHFNLAAAYEALERLPEALRHYRRETEVDPEDGEAPYRVARVLVKQGRMRQAEAWFRKAEAVRAEQPRSFYYYRALMEQSLGDRDRAIADLRRALGIGREDADILDLLVRLKSR